MSRAGFTMRSALLAACAFALAACSGSSANKEPEPNVFPKQYKEQLLITLQKDLEDPTNIKDGAISEPFMTQAGREPRYAVCVRSNSRNYNREYTGLKDRIGYFYAGDLNQLIEASAGQCSKVAYQPWPDLMNMCFSDKKCN